MDLSNDLLSQFAKLTKNDENTKKEDAQTEGGNA